MISYREFDSSLLESVKNIFEKEHWNAYLHDDAKLKRAFDNSLYVLGAFENERLIGFTRCVGDGEHILLVQDLIVEPEHQKQGTNDFISRMDLYPWICALYIEEAYRGHAYGSLLLARAEEDAAKAGYPYAYLCTDHVGYYEKYGFEHIGTGYHPWGETSGIYRIDLQNHE